MARHASFTVGGGGVTAVALERDLTTCGWMDAETFRTYYGLARITPGTVLLALVTALGWHLFRWRGAAAALLIGSVPGCALAAVLSEVQRSLTTHPTGRAFFAGAAAAVCGLLAASIFRIVEPYFDVSRRIASALVLLVCAAGGLLELHPLLLIFGAGLLGALLPNEGSSA